MERNSFRISNIASASWLCCFKKEASQSSRSQSSETANAGGLSPGKALLLPGTARKWIASGTDVHFLKQWTPSLQNNFGEIGVKFDTRSTANTESWRQCLRTSFCFWSDSIRKPFRLGFLLLAATCLLAPTMELRQYRSMGHFAAVGWQSKESSLVTPGVAMGMILFPR